MKIDEDRMDEDRLQALFDATAPDPSKLELSRMAARAVDVPGRARPTPRWLAWGLPSLFAATAAAVLLWSNPGANPDGAATALEPTTAPTAAAAGTSSPLPAEELAFEDDLPPDLLAELDTGFLTAIDAYDDDLGYDDLADDDLATALGEPNEAELDAWLAAADELLGEGKPKP